MRDMAEEFLHDAAFSSDDVKKMVKWFLKNGFEVQAVPPKSGDLALRFSGNISWPNDTFLGKVEKKYGLRVKAKMSSRDPDERGPGLIISFKKVSK